MPCKEIVKSKYDFRDDAPELWSMLKRKYKNKDSQRKIKKIFSYIYDHYEKKCKRCTK